MRWCRWWWSLIIPADDPEFTSTKIGYGTSTLGDGGSPVESNLLYIYCVISILHWVLLLLLLLLFHTLHVLIQLLQEMCRDGARCASIIICAVIIRFKEYSCACALLQAITGDKSVGRLAHKPRIQDLIQAAGCTGGEQGDPRLLGGIGWHVRS